jgi:hypothetical protein
MMLLMPTLLGIGRPDYLNGRFAEAEYGRRCDKQSSSGTGRVKERPAITGHTGVDLEPAIESPNPNLGGSRHYPMLLFLARLSVLWRRSQVVRQRSAKWLACFLCQSA